MRQNKLPDDVDAILLFEVIARESVEIIAEIQAVSEHSTDHRIEKQHGAKQNCRVAFARRALHKHGQSVF